jgi:hypothetical protein
MPVSRTIAVCLVVAACGTDPDPRPTDSADYIIEAILVPYCGRAACHSTDTAAKDLIFDTIDGAKASLTKTERGQKLVVPARPDQSRLYNVLVDSRRVMPPDIPMPTADIDLVRAWITDGAVGLQ